MPKLIWWIHSTNERRKRIFYFCFLYCTFICSGIYTLTIHSDEFISNAALRRIYACFMWLLSIIYISIELHLVKLTGIYMQFVPKRYPCRSFKPEKTEQALKMKLLKCCVAHINIDQRISSLYFIWWRFTNITIFLWKTQMLSLFRVCHTLECS